MEVRSNNEKCGNDAVAVATTTTINPKSLDLIASDDGYNIGRTKCSINNPSPPLTKDESKYFVLDLFNLHRAFEKERGFSYIVKCVVVSRFVCCCCSFLFFVPFCIRKCTYARCERTCDFCVMFHPFNPNHPGEIIENFVFILINNRIDGRIKISNSGCG